MDFTQHLVTYYKGEWLEATLLAAFGVVTVGLVFAIWQNMDSNALLKGLLYPIAFLAALTLLTGGFGIHNNTQRLATMPAQYAQNPTEFVQVERERFEKPNGVNTWWLPLKLLWATLTVVGIAVTFTSRSEFTHGIAIGLIVIGATGFVIDGFAHHRAKGYTAILSAQN